MSRADLATLRQEVDDLERARHALIGVGLATDEWDGLTLADLDRSIDAAIERLLATLARQGRAMPDE